MDFWNDDVFIFLERISKTNNVVSIMFDFSENLTDFQLNEQINGKKLLETMYGEHIFQIKHDFEKIYMLISSEKACSQNFLHEFELYITIFQNNIDLFPQLSRSMYGKFVDEIVDVQKNIFKMLQSGTHIKCGDSPKSSIIHIDVEPLQRSFNKLF